MSNPLEILQGLEPALLWQRFGEITRIPRPSKREDKMRAYVQKVAEEHSWPVATDAAGNVVISVPASPGKEKASVVVLQAHLDMVCEQNSDSKTRPDRDPIVLRVDGDLVGAVGTTLGADNGIGVAAALAAAADETVVHGPLELLFTIDEETGLTGAKTLDTTLISGKLLLNLDSEEEGHLYIGCAGGQDTVGERKLESEHVEADWSAYELTVSGLRGGHSGCDIHLGRGNSIKILGEALAALAEKVSFRIASMKGGSKRNAIPREAVAVICFEPSMEMEAKAAIEQVQHSAAQEFHLHDGEVSVALVPLAGDVPSSVWGIDAQRDAIAVLAALPHGVVTMSQDVADLVETSTNLATIDYIDQELVIGTSQRSSREAARQDIVAQVAKTFSSHHFEVKHGDSYPGWQPNPKSELLATATAAYQHTFNIEPKVAAIHAGLECGILGDRLPGMDMISFGPTVTGAHSPDEQLSIPSVEKFYKFLTAILGELAK